MAQEIDTLTDERTLQRVIDQARERLQGQVMRLRHDSLMEALDATRDSLDPMIHAEGGAQHLILARAWMDGYAEGLRWTRDTMIAGIEKVADSYRSTQH